MTPSIESNVPNPRPGDTIFGPDADWWHNAVVSEFHSSWYVYADGYRQAAAHLVETASLDRSRNDFLVYPIVFLYRQYLELSFKGMLRDVSWLRGDDPPLFSSHSLTTIWNRLRPLLREAIGDDDEIHWQVLTNCVEEFSRCDPSSQTFRYPESRDGSPAGHTVTHINLRRLRDEMDNAYAVIDSLWNYLVVLTDWEQDRRDEGRP